jgi:hypothetical protein
MHDYVTWIYITIDLNDCRVVVVVVVVTALWKIVA